MASEKITNFVEEIKTLTVLELNELVKAIEEKRVRCFRSRSRYGSRRRRRYPRRRREDRV